MDHGLRHDVGARVINVSYPLNKILTALAKAHVTRERLSDAELAGHDLVADHAQAGDSGF